MSGTPQTQMLCPKMITRPKGRLIAPRSNPPLLRSRSGDRSSLQRPAIRKCESPKMISPIAVNLAIRTVRVIAERLQVVADNATRQRRSGSDLRRFAASDPRQGPLIQPYIFPRAATPGPILLHF